MVHLAGEGRLGGDRAEFRSIGGAAPGGPALPGQHWGLPGSGAESRCEEHCLDGCLPLRPTLQSRPGWRRLHVYRVSRVHVASGVRLF